MEAKIALVIVLVAVIGALLYFGTGKSEPIRLGQTPSDTATTENVDLALPIDDTPAEPETLNNDLQTPASDDKDTEPPALTRVEVLDRPDPAGIKLEFSPPPTMTTTAPAPKIETPVPAVAKVETDTVRANQPARIKMDLSSHTQTQPASRISVLPKKTIHTVKSGETLYAIAEQYYGRGDLWTQIARANPQLSNPSKLSVGDKITIPKRDVAIHRSGGIESVEAGQRTYTVKAGESFYSIALEQLGTGSRWRDVYVLNKSRVQNDPKKLKVGQTILLPAR